MLTDAQRSGRPGGPKIASRAWRAARRHALRRRGGARLARPCDLAVRDRATRAFGADVHGCPCVANRRRHASRRRVLRADARGLRARPRAQAEDALWAARVARNVDQVGVFFPGRARSALWDARPTVAKTTCPQWSVAHGTAGEAARRPSLCPCDTQRYAPRAHRPQCGKRCEYGRGLGVRRQATGHTSGQAFCSPACLCTGSGTGLYQCAAGCTPPRLHAPRMVARCRCTLACSTCLFTALTCTDSSGQTYQPVLNR